VIPRVVLDGEIPVQGGDRSGGKGQLSKKGVVVSIEDQFVNLGGRRKERRQGGEKGAGEKSPKVGSPSP